MATKISFYYYDGYTEVCNKRDNMTLLKEVNANLITNRKSKLECIIETNEYVNGVVELNQRLTVVDANYIYFVDWGNRASWWFVTNISRDGANYYYHLKLDVLMTNWLSINNHQLILERSSTLDPLSDYPILDDSLWKIGNKREVIQIDGTGNLVAPTSGVERHFALTTVSRPAGTIIGAYGISGTLASTYLLKQDEASTIASAFYDTSFINSMVIQFTQPASAIISNRIYPFSLDSLYSVDTDKVYFGSEYITGSNGHIFKRATQELITLNFGQIRFSDEMIGDFRDYTPYSDYYIYLPFTGYKDIDIRLFNSGLISIRCVLNIVTGQARFELFDGNIISGKEPILQFPTELGISVPYSTSGIGAAYQSLLNLGISAVSSLATPGYHKSEKGSRELSDIRKRRVKGRLVTSYKRKLSDDIDKHTDSYRDPDFSISPLSHISASTNVMNVSFASDPTTYSEYYNNPFLIIVRPEVNTTLDTIQRDYYGKLVMRPSLLSELSSGYQKFCNVYLPMDGRCTEEQNELIDILENGVWIKQPTL